MEKPDEAKWPAVKVAYDFVMPSYTLLVTRFEAADTRLTILLTFVATITLGAPVFAKTMRPDIQFLSPWFVAAVGAALLSIGIAGRVRGSLILPNPAVVFRESLQESEWSFRKNAIYFAGQHFEKNAWAIRVKGIHAAVSAGFIVIEILLFLLPGLQRFRSSLDRWWCPYMSAGILIVRRDWRRFGCSSVAGAGTLASLPVPPSLGPPCRHPIQLVL